MLQVSGEVDYWISDISLDDKSNNFAPVAAANTADIIDNLILPWSEVESSFEPSKSPNVEGGMCVPP